MMTLKSQIYEALAGGWNVLPDKVKFEVNSDFIDFCLGELTLGEYIGSKFHINPGLDAEYNDWVEENIEDASLIDSDDSSMGDVEQLAKVYLRHSHGLIFGKGDLWGYIKFNKYIDTRSIRYKDFVDTLNRGCDFIKEF